MLLGSCRSTWQSKSQRAYVHIYIYKVWNILGSKMYIRQQQTAYCSMQAHVQGLVQLPHKSFFFSLNPGCLCLFRPSIRPCIIARGFWMSGFNRASECFFQRPQEALLGIEAHAVIWALRCYTCAWLIGTSV